MKKACPDCRLLVGGVSRGPESVTSFYQPMLEALEGRHIDIFDIHLFGFGEPGVWERIPPLVERARSVLTATGYPGTEIWMTEFGTYTGSPLKPGPSRQKVPEQSQENQAEALVKGFVTAFHQGVRTVCWAWGMEDGFDMSGSVFDRTGLISADGEKKLAFHAYGKLIEMLKGCDFSSVRSLNLGPTVKAYEFLKPSARVCVIWTEE
jgi:hypothetical protein